MSLTDVVIILSSSFLRGLYCSQTTIMACVYKGGVVLGADSRTSTGNYIANRASDKITCVTDNVWMCRSGSVRAPACCANESEMVLLLYLYDMFSPRGHGHSTPELNEVVE